MKWKDFKKKLEDSGVKDEDEIAYIEVFHFTFMNIEKTDGGWTIQEW